VLEDFTFSPEGQCLSGLDHVLGSCGWALPIVMMVRPLHACSA
jgi:hypothetical protein